jgi:murein L,D-transpeptidase YafK
MDSRIIQTILAFLSLIFLFSCSREEILIEPSLDEGSPDVEVPVFNQQNVSSSRRSREAVARVVPALVTDLQAQSLSYGSPVFIRIFKEERELEVWLRAGDRFQLFRTYSIAAMSGELGPKLKEGDGQAPEGFYFVPPSHMNPKSRFHLSFNLGYPNAYDRANGRTGSALMVHGGQASVGCFAMTDPKVEEIYALAEAALRNGQRFFRVHSFPFRMTDGNLARHPASRWQPFWLNLKEGYDFFEDSGLPPDVVVGNMRYSFKDSVY